VLNGTSAWWFRATAHLVPNHLISTPHPSVAIVKRCIPFKVEFVVRA
jgi:phosphoribosylaminoimidazole-succinocarboxamide synthase